MHRRDQLLEDFEAQGGDLRPPLNVYFPPEIEDAQRSIIEDEFNLQDSALWSFNLRRFPEIAAQLNKAAALLSVRKVAFTSSFIHDSRGEIDMAILHCNPAPDAPYGVFLPESASRLYIARSRKYHFEIRHGRRHYMPAGADLETRNGQIMRFLMQLISHPDIVLEPNIWAPVKAVPERREIAQILHYLSSTQAFAETAGPPPLPADIQTLLAKRAEKSEYMEPLVRLLEDCEAETVCHTLNAIAGRDAFTLVQELNEERKHSIVYSPRAVGRDGAELNWSGDSASLRIDRGNGSGRAYYRLPEGHETLAETYVATALRLAGDLKRIKADGWDRHFTDFPSRFKWDRFPPPQPKA